MSNNRNPLAQLICYFWYNPLMLAFVMSASLLAGAYGFQYIGGLAPCDLCWTQRYAHMVILGLSGAGLLLKKYDRPLQNLYAWAVIIALDVSIVAAGYHAGIEQKWWAGPTTCTSGSINASADMESLFDSMMESNLVLCDEIPWEMFGISMAGYNFLISFIVAQFVTFAVVFNLRKKHVRTT
ncbi:MAG: disulfide bond formation protein B [Emcibacter sp.]|nr:disulfide bond formation protein B [Emcibacter sp.]